ncbi:Serine/threonine-protein kinase B [compost metagenome]
MRYSHCERSDFSGARLNRSICIGTDFSRGRLTGADLSQSLLYDADFSGSDLRGARLTEAVGGERFIHEGMVLGFGGVRFTDANLEGANLLFADLAGADFRGAHMAGAAILKRDAVHWRLSEEQKRSVVWMEEDDSGVPVPAGE